MTAPVDFEIFKDEPTPEARPEQKANDAGEGAEMNSDGVAPGLSELQDTDFEDARPPAFSDEALALRFAERHARDLRYVAGWGKWLRWDGKCWRFDETLHAFDLSRQTCRQAAGECNTLRLSKALASAKTVAAVERLAKADRRIAATVSQWDTDPWLLNTLDGVVDLRTGKLRPHRSDDYMTRITGAGPGGDCPTFRAFLRRITGESGDELLLFIQRALGYALTGVTREHALFFNHGTGSNGKSVLMNTVAGVFGEYHRVAPIEAFTASSFDRHPTDLAGLRGARLVTATETEEGRRWAESRIKVLTGGDPIAARFMRQDFFEFIPQFKLWISGNHKPGLRSVNEAIRRRFHLVPFTVKIPEDEQDKSLGERLKAEWRGILAWMIEGCRMWQERGLDPPEAVTAATQAYLEGEDALAAWIEDCCVAEANAWERSSALFASWRTWAEQNEEFVGTIRRFSMSLEDRGFKYHKRNGNRGFVGLRVRPSEREPPY